jgi:phospholipase/carboxylesterase
MLVCKPHWQAALPRLAKTPVFQSHGMIDPVLPYMGATALCQLLKEAGIDVDFHSFMGPHTIDGESVTRSAQALATLAGGGE